MKLTKEECIKYKKELLWAHDNVGTKYDTSSIKDAISLGVVYYEKLMNEHFDNPPLKFEKLCEDEPIFDKKHCCWRYVMQKDYDNEGFYDPINDEWIDFEEGRFFAREVKG